MAHKPTNMFINSSHVSRYFINFHCGSSWVSLKWKFMSQLEKTRADVAKNMNCSLLLSVLKMLPYCTTNGSQSKAYARIHTDTNVCTCAHTCTQITCGWVGVYIHICTLISACSSFYWISFVLFQRIIFETSGRRHTWKNSSMHLYMQVSITVPCTLC